MEYVHMCACVRVYVYMCAISCVYHIDCSYGDPEHTTPMEPTISHCLNAYVEHNPLTISEGSLPFLSHLYSTRCPYTSRLNHRHIF